MKSQISIAVGVIVILIGLLIGQLSANKEKMAADIEKSLVINTTVPVIIETPVKATLHNAIVLHGTITPENEIPILSKQQGIIIRKYKKTGQSVRKGEPIVQLENEISQKSLQLAQANYVKLAKDVDRYQILKKNGAVATQELESIQMSLRDMEEHISNLKNQIANSTILSPIDGIIAADYVEEGQFVMTGGQIVQIISGSGLKLSLSTAESDVLMIKKGQEVTVKVSALAGQSIKGIVELISPKANNLHYYIVDITLKENNPDLRAGMFASAELSLTAKNTAADDIVISRKAIVGSIKKPYVYVVKNGIAQKREISLDSYNDKQIVVRSGITCQDTVITSGQINLSDGFPVTILNK